ncbi:MAG: transposase [Acidobacteriaceae bacterium]|nr:transposase [Acidobacteriaceae bacterium]
MTEPEAVTTDILPDPALDSKSFKKLLMDRLRAQGGSAAVDTKLLFQNMVKETLEAFSRTRDGTAPRLRQARTGRSRHGQLAQWRHGQDVRGDFGEVEIETPRDRNASFAPKIVAKRQTSVGNFSEAVVSLYARGLTTREIEQHVIVDGLRVAVRTDKGVLKKCVYTVLGVSLSGKQEVLGLWIEETEGARFWLKVFNDLKARGTQDVLIVCGDGLTGLRQAVESVFPQADVQLCVVHHIRNVTKFVSWKDRKPVCAGMRPIYTAATVEGAELALDRFAQSGKRAARPLLRPAPSLA